MWPDQKLIKREKVRNMSSSIIKLGVKLSSAHTYQHLPSPTCHTVRRKSQERGWVQFLTHVIIANPGIMCSVCVLMKIHCYSNLFSFSLKKNMKAKRTAKPNPDYFLTWHKEEWWLENPQAADSLYARKCLDEANPGNNFSHHLLPCLVYTGMSLEWGGRPETTIKISC